MLTSIRPTPPRSPDDDAEEAFAGVGSAWRLAAALRMAGLLAGWVALGRGGRLKGSGAPKSAGGGWGYGRAGVGWGRGGAGGARGMQSSPGRLGLGEGEGDHAGTGVGGFRNAAVAAAL